MDSELREWLSLWAGKRLCRGEGHSCGEGGTGDSRGEDKGTGEARGDDEEMGNTIRKDVGTGNNRVGPWGTCGCDRALGEGGATDR